MLISYLVIACVRLKSLTKGKADLVTCKSPYTYLIDRLQAYIHGKIDPEKKTNLLATGFISSRQVVSMSKNNFNLGGGGGGVALGRILLVLPKIGSKLELSLMRLLRAKFGKICQWTTP